ncbi:MAG: hypothetical protein KGR26_10635 [Cyanobacteria bacterium REEB65]|nr:hypothetical protein [Cyanobacteria bacterium REEB65]
MDPSLPEIRAARLVITDAAGTPRIVLELDGQGEPAVRLFDRNGGERAFLALSSPEHPSGGEPVTRAHLRLAASDGGTVIDLSAFEAGYGTIEMANHPEEFAHVLLEVEQHRSGRQATLVLGDRQARAQFLVRDGSAKFETESG